MDMNKYGEKLGEIEKQIEKALGDDVKRFVNYSAYKTDKDRIPINNLDEIAFEGKIRFREKRDPLWSSQHGADFESQVLINPTWLDLAVVANKMIETVRDFHHVFLELIEIKGEEDGVTIAEFGMGS